MHSGYTATLVLAFLGMGIGLVLSFLFRSDKKKLFAAYGGGLVVSCVDYWGAFLAHRMDWWHLNGAWMVANVPLSMNVGWIFLGAGYCLLYSLTDKMPHPKLAKILTVTGTSCYGVLNDYLITRFGILRLGTGMKIYYTFPYWLILVTGTILVFEFLLKKSLNGNEK